ncbi:hypothetical protein D9613_004836 [Agrocybe pediades]|uniref:Argonaute-like protein n=1 Tax=Agrocybe pediades TaxID=84607 RepID=A0A8H4QYX4_9AGAR|nr:hypothetical protein D9613_004836 [Agrocybe pediades]
MPPRIAPTRGSGPRGGGPTRGGGAGRGGVPVGTMTGNHLKTVGVPRPGFGTGGRAQNIYVNAFASTIPDIILHHYDAISPDTLPARVNMLIINQLTRVVAPVVFSAPVAYDGRKNIYSTYKLNLGPSDSTSFDVTLPRTGQQAPSANSKPPKIYTVKVTKVAEINTEILHRFISGKQSEDSAVSTSLMALNTVIRMQPNQQYPFNVRSFFTDRGSKQIGGALELWRGYFQSLRPSQGRMYINLDIATAVMFRRGPLPAVMLDFFGLNPSQERMLSTKELPEQQRIRVQKFIAGVRVRTTYGDKREYVIKKISSQSAEQLMFATREGKSMSVATYFKTLNIRLKFPGNGCIEVGSGAFIPIELCELIEGQFMRRQVPAEKTNDMLEFSKMSPTDRLGSIREGLAVLQYGQSEYVRQFGMNVQQAPLALKARVLPAPTLKYAQVGRESSVKPFNGSWNMRDKKFFQPQAIPAFFVVSFDTRFGENEAQQMLQDFRVGAQSVGMNVVQPSHVHHFECFSPHASPVASMNSAGQRFYEKYKQAPQMAIVVLPENGNGELYTGVKYWGDVARGVVTQCLKSGKARKAKAQYWANVLLKVNAKLGGINCILDKFAAFSDPHNPTIVMGADVIHPAPGADGRPSFTSLVTSVDSNVSKYIAETRVQEGRVEIIEDLEEMCTNALKNCMAYKAAVEKGSRPVTRLIFYRDGVSEGQFQQVLEHELKKIKDALKAMNMGNVKVTLIVVGKRHHIRFFPQNPRSSSEADNTGNCLAGTTVDEGLGHPTEFDYYQLTHGGLLGTSRPAHYSVLHDDNKFTPDALQELSFALCHVYARATRSVSIPAPVYYADIVCARSKNHFNPSLNFQSEAASSTGAPTIESYKKHYAALHANQARKMYFM